MPGKVIMASFYLLVVSDTGFARTGHCGMPGMLPTRFSRSDKICCGGQLHNKTRNGQEVLCCEGPQKTYLKTSQICSRDHVVLRGHQYCTSVSVNLMAGDMCCDGVPYFYKNMSEPAAAQRCCGKSLMNKDKLNDQCCGGSIISKRVKCCGNRLKGQKYDNRKQICCEGRRGSSFLVNKTHHNQNSCCKGKLYDKFSHRCTHHGIVHKSQVCQENDKDLCCQGNLFKGAKGRGQFHCCLDKPYDVLSQGCCAGVVYQLNTHECYGGRVVDKDRPSKRHKPSPAPPTHKPTPAPPIDKPTPALPADKLTPAPPIDNPTPAPPADKLTPAPPIDNPTPAPPADKLKPAPPIDNPTPAPPADNPTPATPADKPTNAPPIDKQTAVPPAPKPKHARENDVNSNSVIYGPSLMLIIFHVMILLLFGKSQK